MWRRAFSSSPTFPHFLPFPSLFSFAPRLSASIPSSPSFCAPPFHSPRLASLYLHLRASSFPASLHPQSLRPSYNPSPEVRIFLWVSFPFTTPFPSLSLLPLVISGPLCFSYTRLSSTILLPTPLYQHPPFYFPAPLPNSPIGPSASLSVWSNRSFYYFAPCKLVVGRLYRYSFGRILCFEFFSFFCFSFYFVGLASLPISDCLSAFLTDWQPALPY